MSRVDELIEKLCPNGVTHKSLGDLCAIASGGTPASGRADYYGGDIPWCAISDISTAPKYVATTSKTITDAGLANSSAKLFEAGTLLLSIYASLGEVTISAVPMATNQAILGLVPKAQDEVMVDFLYYLLKKSKQQLIAQRQSGSQNNLNKGIVSSFRVPVPPLEVQREIVRILDQFTQLEAELEAELEARRAQYAHYRDELVRDGTSQYDRLADIGSFLRGRRFTKKDVVEVGIPSLHYGEIYTHYGTSAEHAIRHVRSELREHLRYAEPGSVVFAGVGETVEDVGKAVAWLGKEPIAVHDDTFAFTSDLDPKYVAYAVQTADFHRQKERYVSRAKVKRLSASGLGDIEIPVPSLVKQRQIVAALDKFDGLVNDISVGLPAELNARRKQYEYYRDRLLTFKEAT